MKKIIVPFLFVLTAFLSSCDTQKSKTFNDKLVGIQKDLINKTEAIMKGPNEKENRIKANDYIKKKLDELKKVEAVSGGEAFKQAMIDDVNALSKVYELAVKIDADGTTKEEQEALTKEQEALLTKISVYDQEVLEQQRKFAKAKGFKLEYR